MSKKKGIGREREGKRDRERKEKKGIWRERYREKEKGIERKKRRGLGLRLCRWTILEIC